MPNVFISYAREDLAVVRQLEQALKTSGIAVWRDQESLYGGQQWPKAIGEAISAHDVLLLAWSQHAAASHFVELEWTTAIALRKTILPCLLDETPLPPALSAINGIEMRVLEAALPKILQALQRPVATTDPEHRAEVLDRLQEISSARPFRSGRSGKNRISPARVGRPGQCVSSRQRHASHCRTAGCESPKDHTGKMANVGGSVRRVVNGRHALAWSVGKGWSS